MKTKENREKWANYDPIAWSKCNIYYQKYPNDEKIQYICRVWHRPPPIPVNLHELASLRLEGMQVKKSAGVLC